MPSVCQTHPSALKLQRWMRTGHALEELAQLLPRWVTMYKALCEHGKEKIRSALEQGRSPSDRNQAEPPASMKCLIGRDQELWQREWGQCSECLENCGQGVWMPGVEKVESLLGEGAGVGMVTCPEGQTKACGFSPPGNRGHSCSLRRCTQHSFGQWWMDKVVDTWLCEMNGSLIVGEGKLKPGGQ